MLELPGFSITVRVHVLRGFLSVRSSAIGCQGTTSAICAEIDEIAPAQRMASGALAAVVAQVRVACLGFL